MLGLGRKDLRMKQDKKIKICVFTTIALTIKTFLLEQLIFLADNGFEVTIVCNYDEELAKKIPTNMTYYPISMDREKTIGSTLAGFFHIYRFLRNNKFEMVQYSTPKAAFLASISGWLVHVPVRLYCQWGIRYVGLQGLSRFILKNMEKLICSCSTHISPDSYGNVEFSVSEGLYGKDKASIVHFGSANGVDLTRFNCEKRNQYRDRIREQLGISNESVVFGAVGRITKDKGVKELVEAFVEIVNKDSSAHLVMVGAMEEQHGLASEIIELIRTHPNIHYVGKQELVEAYYSVMDVFILPSYREGFGSVMLEAQGMGIPVIATDIPGPREALVNEKTGVLVPVGTTAPLCAAMEKFKNDLVLRESMGREGIEYVQSKFEQKMFWLKVLEHRVALVRQAYEKNT